ncbi:MAG: putrescine ABC transporter permease PotH, partial [Desulfobacteraceae bacterium 4572_123]
MVIKRFLPSGRTTVIGIPFLWLLLFLVIPFAIVLKISFAEMAVARPPFTELFTFAEEKLSVILNLGNYLFLIEDHLYTA